MSRSGLVTLGVGVREIMSVCLSVCVSRSGLVTPGLGVREIMSVCLSVCLCVQEWARNTGHWSEGDYVCLFICLSVCPGVGS